MVQKCSVLGCTGVGNARHRFPNPKKQPERFLQWIRASGNPALLELSPVQLRHQCICGLHFEKKYLLNIKLSHTAVPTLSMPEPICTLKYKQMHMIKERQEEMPNINVETECTTFVVDEEEFNGLSAADTDQLLTDRANGEKERMEVIETAEEMKTSNENENSPLTAGLIKEGLQMASKLESHFLMHDPIVERAEQFKQELQSCMACYQDLYKDLVKEESQRLITEFTVKTDQTSPVESIAPLQHECNGQSITNDKSNFTPAFHKEKHLLLESHSK